MAILGLDTIVINEALTGFETILMPISAFSWVAEQKDSTLNDVVKVPYITNKSGSSAFTYAAGYTGDGTSVISKDVTLNQILFQKTDIQDNAMSKLSNVSLARIAQSMGQALARDVIAQTLALVTDANFPTSASITSNMLTASAGLSALNTQADNFNWTTNRSMILNPAAWGYLLQNPDVSKANQYGGSEAVRSGLIPAVYGFTPNKYTGLFPTKAQPIQGIVTDPSSIVLAMGVHGAGPDSKGLVNIERAVSPSGLVLQLKHWYDPNYATSRLVIECLFGCAVGNATGLVQLK